MHIDELLPGPRDRGFAGGTTGSGKTTLFIKIILQLVKNENPLILIFDTDHMWEFQEYTSLKWKPGIPVRITNIRQIMNETQGLFLYQCKYPAMRDPMVEALLVWALEHGHMTVVIDEVGDFSNGVNVFDPLGRCIKQGRKKNLRMLIGYQRSQGIPPIVITESRYFYIFELRSEKDRERLADRAHPAFIIQMSDYDFMFWKPNLAEPLVILGGAKRYDDPRQLESSGRIRAETEQAAGRNSNQRK